MDKTSEIFEYKRNVGHEPRNLPEDHPDRWQWLYRGTREEREQLLDRLFPPEVEGDTPTQEELF